MIVFNAISPLFKGDPEIKVKIFSSKGTDEAEFYCITINRMPLSEHNLYLPRRIQGCMKRFPLSLLYLFIFIIIKVFISFPDIFVRILEFLFLDPHFFFSFLVADTRP